MPDTQRIVDASDLRKYRHEFPNLIDDMELSPHAYRLYGHIKRRAGGSDGGECYEGARRMAEHCKMSLGMIVRAKQELEKAGLIKIKPGDPKTSTPDTITIVDIWRQNFLHYQTCSPNEQPVQNMNTPVHEEPQTCSNDEHPCSQYERKKEPPEERTKEEESQSIPACAERLLACYAETVKPVENLHINTRNAWKTLIRVRLQEGWTEAQLAKAFKGCSLDDWKDRWKWNKVTDILKDRDSIEQFINYADEMPKRAQGNGKTSAQPKSNYGKPPVTRDFSKYPSRT